MSRTLAALAPLALACILTAGCFIFPGSRRNADGLGWKAVMEKREPVYLIAIDGTECTVSSERWAQAKPGRQFFCHWQRPEAITGWD